MPEGRALLTWRFVELKGSYPLNPPSEARIMRKPPTKQAEGWQQEVPRFGAAICLGPEYLDQTCDEESSPSPKERCYLSRNQLGWLQEVPELDAAIEREKRDWRDVTERRVIAKTKTRHCKTRH